MAANSSYETSWADQWDPEPSVYPTEATKKSSGGATEKYKKKVGEGFGKTKVIASTGMKKVKEGTFVGFNWIKDKYQKTTRKN